MNSLSVDSTQLHRSYHALAFYASSASSRSECELRTYVDLCLREEEETHSPHALYFEQIATFLNQNVRAWNHFKYTVYLRGPSTGLKWNVIVLSGYPFVRFKGGVLGQGTFKKVVVCLDPFAASEEISLRALMIMPLRDPQSRLLAQQEINCLAQKLPGAPQFFGGISYYSKYGERRLACVVERILGCSLNRMLVRDLSWNERHGLAMQLCHLLHALHAAHWVHGDLSSNNIMVTFKGPHEMRLIDFGAGGVCREGGVYHSYSATTWCYCAPEILTQELNACSMYEKTHASDLWALGVLLLEIYGEQVPDHLFYLSPASFEEGYDHAATWQTKLIKWTTGEEYTILPSFVLQLVTELLSKEPSERPSAALVLYRAQKGFVNWELARQSQIDPNEPPKDK